ncbi:MAG: DUF4160 domain-containing protein [Bacteroidetes bacterium]|nr:MAG: DUF4160 domain-containing protein [Bacteroidota bacterium]PTM13039.1 MAG: DUF4160 domain-containing protein [Bacteroidota bacterium]
MPLIITIDSIKIYIYLRDHNPPHFHIIYAEHEELIDMRTLTTYSGSVPSKQRKKVIKWAKENEAYLNEKWAEYNPDNEKTEE